MLGALYGVQNDTCKTSFVRSESWEKIREDIILLIEKKELRVALCKITPLCTLA